MALPIGETNRKSLSEMLFCPVEAGGGILPSGEKEQGIFIFVFVHLSLFLMWFPKLHRKTTVFHRQN
jgi:hypothetical protein